MPLVEVTYRAGTPETALRDLGRCLPHAVSEAVACVAEPYEPPLRPGDVEIRFRELGRFDVCRIGVYLSLPVAAWAQT